MLTSFGYATNGFSTNFNRTDIFVVLILCIVVFIVNYALKLAIGALQHTIKQRKKDSILSEKEEEKIIGNIDNI